MIGDETVIGSSARVTFIVSLELAGEDERLRFCDDMFVASIYSSKLRGREGASLRYMLFIWMQ